MSGSDWQPLPPACMKCETVTGKSTCFPGPCVFYHERNIAGTKANQIAILDRVRRGMRDPVYTDEQPAPTVQASMGDECGCIACRSDLAGLVPCEGETASTMEDDRG